ncbi:MAG: glycosyltransferase family 2 protein [Verrucomicrobiae bacterium]|nr:glycosyltransferase family 2 protein [Verrucomicrobiae bacterium]
MTSTPLARVLIVNYNSGGYLQRCVSALLSQTMRDFEVVVVDNASTDGSLEGLPQDERLRIDRAGVNLGFAAGNNRAAADATAPFLVMLNPDAIPAPDWLERLCDVAKCRPDVALFGSLQLQDRDPTRIDGAGDVYFFAGTAWRHRYGAQRGTLAGHYTTFGACAAAALIRREWFERLGGFDADYFCYFEDVDLAFRLRLLGGHVLQVNDAVVRHAGSATTGAGSDFVMYHCTRNQLWTFLKAMPGPLLLPLLPIHMALLLGKWLNAARQGRGAIIAKGIGDGLRAIRPVLAKRAAIQRTRSASTFAVASAMTWSPTAFLKRGGEGPPPAQP